MHWHAPHPLDIQTFDPAQVFTAGLRQHHIANTAYPIAHVHTMRPYKLTPQQTQQLAPAFWEGIDRFSLYVHIPFCEARCGFCEYTVVDPATRLADEAPYFELLQHEFHLWQTAFGTRSKTLIGFDIGGGTPSTAQTQHIEQVLAAAQRVFNLPDSVEISIETTPKIAAEDPGKIAEYYRLGIRRISMGVQTINPNLLQQVGRTATSQVWNQRAAEHIRKAGFQNFNVDVMYGFAHQSLDSLEATLRHVFNLNPEAITLYRMRYKGTRLAAQAQDITLDEVNAQKHLLEDLLHAHGYIATPGKNTFSRIPNDPGTSHYITSRVVEGIPYLGLGLGAQSLSETSLSYNSGAADKRLNLYAQKLNNHQFPIQDLYHLSLPVAMAKFIAVAFYFGEINLAAFQRKFGQPLSAAFPAELAFVQQTDLMHFTADSLRLTPYGADCFSGVIALFYAGAVKAHLLNLPQND